MPRPLLTTTPYKVSLHLNNGYRYASTQRFRDVDHDSGKKRYSRIHWGTLTEEMKFIPGKRYILSSLEERSKLIFPVAWDMSEAEKLSGLKKAGRPAYDEQDVNRFYGDLWLLDQVAKKTGIREDLMKVFWGNREIVDDILTLSMFGYVTGFSYNRVVRWQRLAKSLSDRDLTATYITRLTQSITERHRMDLFRLRAGRLGKEELCAVDSTSRSAYGKTLADIHWGKNKEHIPLEQTVEVVVYTLEGHMPVYYRTFPGNIPDSRSLATILTDLQHANFHNVVLVTDRGYESLRNLERYIREGQAMIMCVKAGQKTVTDKIRAFGHFDSHPAEMDLDIDTNIYSKQYVLKYRVEGNGTAIIEADRLKLNLYFDPVRRSTELVELEKSILIQRKALEEIQSAGLPLDDDTSIRKNYCYFLVEYSKTDRKLTSFSLNDKKVDTTRLTSGFYALVTHRIDYPAQKVLATYKLRDEQEKYFQQMKGQMSSDRQRNWSEEGKTGRLFILFVSMILGSYVRHIWKSTELHKKFSSSLEVLDEMRSIRCVEHTGKAKHITPFVGAQLDVCKAFGFPIPKGCEPAYISKQKSERKRGRPSKKRLQMDS